MISYSKQEKYVYVPTLHTPYLFFLSPSIPYAMSQIPVLMGQVNASNISIAIPRLAPAQIFKFL